MRKLLIVLAALTATQPALADAFDDYKAHVVAGVAYQNLESPDLTVEKFYLDGSEGRARIIVRIDNRTGLALGMVIVSCAFLDSNLRAIDTATLIATKIADRETAYANGWSAQIGGIEKAQCRISSFR